MPHFDRRMLPFAAQPQVAMVHQEIDAMIFRSDRIRRSFGNALDHVDLFEIHFVAAGGARLCPHLAANDDRRLLRQILDRLERLLGQVRLHCDTLHNPGAIAKQRERDFAGFA